MWATCVMENRNGLVVNTRLTQATGRAEREAALAMVEEIPGLGRVTLGADKGYDGKEFVRELRDHQVTPHIAQKPIERIDRRTSRHLGYAISQWQAQTGRGDLRLAQDRGRAAQDSSSRSRTGLAGCLPWRWRLTTWCGCATCCPHRYKSTGKLRVAIPSEAVNTLSTHLPAIPAAGH